MSETNYIGLDVHKETISIAVLNDNGKLVMEYLFTVWVRGVMTRTRKPLDKFRYFG